MSKSRNMRKRRGKGAGLVILIFSIVAFIVYAYFLLGTDWGIVVLRLTVLGAVTALLAVLAWIGYTMATAPELEGQ
jgi:predicted DNA-binding transcriptional regulator